MNELDFKLRELWCLVLDIEEFDLSNSPKTKWDDVRRLKQMIAEKDHIIKKIYDLKNINEV